MIFATRKTDFKGKKDFLSSWMIYYKQLNVPWTIKHIYLYFLTLILLPNQENKTSEVSNISQTGQFLKFFAGTFCFSDEAKYFARFIFEDFSEICDINKLWSNLQYAAADFACTVKQYIFVAEKIHERGHCWFIGHCFN